MAAQPTPYVSANRLSDGVAVHSAVMYAAYVDGNVFVNDGRTILRVLSSAGVTRVVTVVTPNTLDDLAISDLTMSIDDSTIRYLGPFPTSVYGTTVLVTFDVETGIKILPMRMV